MPILNMLGASGLAEPPGGLWALAQSCDVSRSVLYDADFVYTARVRIAGASLFRVPETNKWRLRLSPHQFGGSVQLTDVWAARVPDSTLGSPLGDNGVAVLFGGSATVTITEVGGPVFSDQFTLDWEAGEDFMVTFRTTTSLQLLAFSSGSPVGFASIYVTGDETATTGSLGALTDGQSIMVSRLENLKESEPEPEPGTLYRGTKYYWEVVVARSAGGNNNGYIGVGTEESSISPHDSGLNPVNAGQVGYRGIGVLWSANAQVVTGLPTYTNGDVVMFAFDTVTGELWIGKNGTWVTNPDSQSPTFTVAGYSDSPFVPPPGDSAAFVQGRDVGDGGTVRGRVSDFAYTMPTTCRPIQEDAGPALYREDTRPSGYSFTDGGATLVNATGGANYGAWAAVSPSLLRDPPQRPADNLTANGASYFLGGNPTGSAVVTYRVDFHMSGTSPDELSFQTANVWVELEI